LAKESENNLLQWIVAGSLLFVSLAVVGGALFLQQRDQRRHEEELVGQKKAAFDYETRTRGSLVRVYQNLKLDHFLAAYKNIETLEVPSTQFVDVYREYHEVLQRIARGLMDNDFLNEAESLLNKLRNAIEFEDRAREMLIEIASRRRWKSAQTFLAGAKKFLDEKKYRDSVSEFAKAKSEYESVRLFKIHNVDAEMSVLASYIREARFHISFGDAHASMIEAQKSIDGSFFTEAAERIRKAGDAVARATFYGGARNEVLDLRRKLVAMETELAYKVPNALPIQNRVQPAQFEALENFFYLESAQFDVKNFPAPVEMALKYRYRKMGDAYYVIRYRVHLADGRFFFDGKLVAQNEPSDQEIMVEEKILIEVPEAFRSQRIKKIELEVHDSRERRFSLVKRAFRLAQAS
jgi:hypothetical protein